MLQDEQVRQVGQLEQLGQTQSNQAKIGTDFFRVTLEGWIAGWLAAAFLAKEMGKK